MFVEIWLRERRIDGVYGGRCINLVGWMNLLILTFWLCCGFWSGVTFLVSFVCIVPTTACLQMVVINPTYTFCLGIFFAYTHEFEMTLGVLSAFLLRMYESKESIALRDYYFFCFQNCSSDLWCLSILPLSHRCPRGWAACYI